MPDLSIRSNQAELMDDPDAPEKELRQNLRELETINTLLGGYAVVLHALQSLNLPKAKTTHITDMGSGGGDMLRQIDKWAKGKQLSVQLKGIDYNPVMIAYALEHSSDSIEYKQLSVTEDAIKQEHTDIVLCNLFCHHFTNEELVPMLQTFCSISRKAVIINDLHRHWFAYRAIAVLTTLFSKTYMVKHDAKLSVARAFKRKDIERILAEARISNYSIRWRWAWRWEVIIHKVQDAV